MLKIFYRYTNLIIPKAGMDCKPVVLISLMLVTFWFMLSYLTSSYFAIFLIFSNFILLFACCVSLSGYALRRYIDARPETSPVVEVSTISGSTTPYIIPDFPPPYEEAIRIPVVATYHIINGHPVEECVVCAAHRNSNLLKETIQQSSGTNLSQDNDMCSHPELPSSPPSYSSPNGSVNSDLSSNSSIHHRSPSISSSDSITRHRESISDSCRGPTSVILNEETRQDCESNTCHQN